ncbi:uncharacterized protein LOC124165979 isoform X2 [Ischnura elegans]|uniref:uncharacterized protein LOC124165979 isoform X2 n=1 Tax=Ischnura elegans TaxID=197161 RepID=UPI001ED8A557|nr:uncharacterized protein LOC124165979 isoform X2 [Ischnura elegans]
MMANEYEDIPLTKPLRLIEMVFCAVLFGLLIHICSAIALMSYLSTMYVTFGGFLLITATDVISQLAADPIPDTPMFLLSLAGCALFLTTGGLSLDTLFDHTSKIAEDGAKIKMLDMELIFMAALSILNGVIFLVDAALIFRDQTMVEKLSKRPTSAEVEDRLMGTEEIRGGGVYIRARRGGASGEQAPTLYERYTSEQSYIPPIPGTPRISVTYGGNVRMAEETLNSQRTSKLGSHSHRSQERSMRTSPASSFMFDDMDYLSTPRSGGPRKSSRSRRRFYRSLIWQRDRTVSFHLKVLESALGIACLCIFVPEVWPEKSTSPVETAITLSALVTAVVLATALTVNTLARNPPHRIQYLPVAITGAVSYYTIAAIRFSSGDNLSMKMETPVLISGAVSLVDAALCLATFINNTAAAEQPQRPARRVDKARAKQTDPNEPQELAVKKTKKGSILARAKKYFKRSEPQ